MGSDGLGGAYGLSEDERVIYVKPKIKDVNKEILEYCRPHTDKMWAANIVSIILNCDFRDAKQKLNEYFSNKE